MIPLNHVAVWLAAVAHFAVGAVWYTLLSQAWLDGIGRTMDDLVRASPGPAVTYTVAFMAIVIMAYTLAWLMRGLGVRSSAGGLAVGMVVGAGISAMQLAINVTFEARPWTLWLINAGYAVIALGVAGAVIGAFARRAHAPA